MRNHAGGPALDSRSGRGETPIPESHRRALSVSPPVGDYLVRTVSIFSVLVVFAGSPAVRAADDTEGALLRALGGATAAYLFETHQKIGMLNDARTKKLYTADQCDQEITVTINILKVVDKQMGELLDSNIAAGEKKTVKSVRTIIQKQIKAAEALKSYWSSKDSDDLSDYRTNRDAGWEELRKLMGLEKNPGGIGK
jgi:hypothetical protein